MDALGRNQELNKLDDFLAGAVQLFGPQALSRVNISEYLRRRATARGVDTKNLIYDEERGR